MDNNQTQLPNFPGPVKMKMWSLLFETQGEIWCLNYQTFLMFPFILGVSATPYVVLFATWCHTLSVTRILTKQVQTSQKPKSSPHDSLAKHRLRSHQEGPFCQRTHQIFSSQRSAASVHGSPANLKRLQSLHWDEHGDRVAVSLLSYLWSTTWLCQFGEEKAAPTLWPKTQYGIYTFPRPFPCSLPAPCQG